MCIQFIHESGELDTKGSGHGPMVSNSTAVEAPREGLSESDGHAEKIGIIDPVDPVKRRAKVDQCVFQVRPRIILLDAPPEAQLIPAPGTCRGPVQCCRDVPPLIESPHGCVIEQRMSRGSFHDHLDGLTLLIDQKQHPDVSFLVLASGRDRILGLGELTQLTRRRTNFACRGPADHYRA
jgi:hypothetical protein